MKRSPRDFCRFLVLVNGAGDGKQLVTKRGEEVVVRVEGESSKAWQSKFVQFWCGLEEEVKRGGQSSIGECGKRGDGGEKGGCRGVEGRHDGGVEVQLIGQRRNQRESSSCCLERVHRATSGFTLNSSKQWHHFKHIEASSFSARRDILSLSDDDVGRHRPQ